MKETKKKNDYVFYDSTYMKFQKIDTDLQWQKADQYCLYLKERNKERQERRVIKERKETFADENPRINLTHPMNVSVEMKNIKCDLPLE